MTQAVTHSEPSQPDAPEEEELILDDAWGMHEVTPEQLVRNPLYDTTLDKADRAVTEWLARAEKTRQRLRHAG